MDRPTLEVADIFRRYGDAYRDAAGPALSPAQRRVMTAIESCRTAALGGHVEQCNTIRFSVTGAPGRALCLRDSEGDGPRRPRS